MIELLYIFLDSEDSKTLIKQQIAKGTINDLKLQNGLKKTENKKTNKDVLLDDVFIRFKLVLLLHKMKSLRFQR
jgi:hypothetical protein